MVLVAYGRWSFTRGSNCKALTVFFDWRSLTRGGRTWGSTVFGKSRRGLSLIVAGEWWGTVW